MKTRQIIVAAACCLTVMLAGCASHKTIGGVSANETATGNAQGKSEPLDFVRKVSDQKVYAKNIVGKMTLNVKMGSKDVSVPGALRMRRDEVIRIQAFIPILGSEVGRIEFTPDYVLVLDRMHKEYIKADYNQLDFLRDNGLNFYSLQALFWNQLFLPGSNKVGEGDMDKFRVSATSKFQTVSLHMGNMDYTWSADVTGRIAKAKVNHSSTSHGNSTLDWDYSRFVSVGSKFFPARQSFSFSSAAIKGKGATGVVIDMDEVKTDEKWEARTEVSSRYKKVEASDVFGKLLNF
ncbi:MAG: DUF4292 domain-containing protein [Prevotella sp.]|nr:DUF4292 domain-containing protein [Prevotella sp.]